MNALALSLCLALGGLPPVLAAAEAPAVTPDPAVTPAPAVTPDPTPQPETTPLPVPNPEAPPAVQPAPVPPGTADQEEEEDAEEENEDMDPRTGERIRRPPGYAPAVPQPFLRGPQLMFVQFVAGLGARGLVGALGVLPVVGSLSLLVTPAAEAAAVILSGDRMGPYRAWLLWPLLASYAVSASTVVLSTLLMLTGMAVFSLASSVLSPALLGAAIPVWLVVAGVVVALAGAGLVGGGALISSLGNYVISPAASVAAYHLARTPKRWGDLGTGLPRLFPRDRGPRLPFFFGRGSRQPEDLPGDEEGCQEDGSLPVHWRGNTP